VKDIQECDECDEKLECLWVSIVIMPEVQPCLRECQTKERSTEKQPDKNGSEGSADVNDGRASHVGAINLVASTGAFKGIIRFRRLAYLVL